MNAFCPPRPTSTTSRKRRARGERGPRRPSGQRGAPRPRAMPHAHGAASRHRGTMRGTGNSGLETPVTRHSLGHIRDTRRHLSQSLTRHKRRDTTRCVDIRLPRRARAPELDTVRRSGKYTANSERDSAPAPKRSKPRRGGEHPCHAGKGALTDHTIRDRIVGFSSTPPAIPTLQHPHLATWGLQPTCAPQSETQTKKTQPRHHTHLDTHRRRSFADQRTQDQAPLPLDSTWLGALAHKRYARPWHAAPRCVCQTSFFAASSLVTVATIVAAVVAATIG
jgi:hypothetical protein